MTSPWGGKKVICQELRNRPHSSRVGFGFWPCLSDVLSSALCSPAPTAEFLQADSEGIRPWGQTPWSAPPRPALHWGR